jgi:LEA14-like dessication related protein
VKEEIAISSQGSSPLPVPVSIVFAEAAGAVEAMASAKEVHYTVEVELYFSLPVLDEVSIKTAHSGKLPVPRVPTFTGATVTVEKIDFRGAEAVFSLTAGNPNIFSLLINEMDASLVVSGDTWAEVGLTGTGPVEIPPGEEKRLEFPMKMNFLSLGKTAFNLLFRGGELNFTLRGGVEVGAGLPFFQSTTLPLNVQGAADILRNRED